MPSPPAFTLSPTEEALAEFWSEIAQQTLHWVCPWKTTLKGNLKKGHVEWFQGGLLNVSENCLDRHLQKRGNQPALIWEGDDEKNKKTLTFEQLHAEVCRMSNVLKQLKIHKGDTVAIYLPMIPEAAIAMLACTRLGAVHTVIFAGFSAQALKQRLQASHCKCLITADDFMRGGKMVPLKEYADKANAELQIPMLLVNHHTSHMDLNDKQYSWEILRNEVSAECPAEPMNAEDPLFILYTSGSTGAPKGVVHTTGGYLVQTAYTHQLIFNCSPGDVFWCTADVGWITGHSYVVYGPLCNGITTLMFEGIPTWPDPSRNWQIIDRYKVNVFYTAPTAIRSLMKAGNQWLQSSSRASLRLLGSVGEPINPEAWQWYFDKVGQCRCPIMDTWWQTETGSIMMSPKVEDVLNPKPGAACHPIPGIIPVLLDDKGRELIGAAEGFLALKYPWPSMARTLAGDHKRYCKTYLSHGYYISGDGARRDKDGDYWITGRVDDVINVSGHRLGTAEIESALVSHPQVAEAAVVGIPHDLKGQGIHAYVILKQDQEENPSMKEELIAHVKEEISAIAKPDVIQIVSDLPKTRSGKIMRRILRKIACGEVAQKEDLGDLSTLANPQAVEELIIALVQR